MITLGLLSVAAGSLYALSRMYAKVPPQPRPRKTIKGQIVVYR